MKERPILFSAPMVRAILAGTKTQTRRLVGLDTLKRSDTPGYDWTWRGRAPIRSIAQQRRHPGGCWQDATDDGFIALCPYGYPGDRLWVREAFTHITGNGIRVHYRADGEPTDREGRALPTEPGARRWFPSIHMPRKASRITLEIASVRVERLHAITEDGARAEGVDISAAATAKQDTVDTYGMTPYRAAFACVWDEINGDRALWAANPWVWAMTFKRVEQGA